MARLSWGAVVTTTGESFDPGGFGFSPTTLATVEKTTLGIVEEGAIYEARRFNAWWPKPWKPDPIMGSVGLFVGDSGGNPGDVAVQDVLYTFDANPLFNYNLGGFMDTIRIKRIDPNHLLWATSTVVGLDGIFAAVPMDGTPPAWWTHTPTDLTLESQFTSGGYPVYGCYAATVFEPKNGSRLGGGLRITARMEATWRDADGNFARFGVQKNNSYAASVLINNNLYGRHNSYDQLLAGHAGTINWLSLDAGGTQVGIQGTLTWPVAVSFPTNAEASMHWWDGAWTPGNLYRYVVYMYDDTGNTPTIVVAAAANTPLSFNPGGGDLYLTRTNVDLSSYSPSPGCSRVYAYVWPQVSVDFGATWTDLPIQAALFSGGTFNIINPQSAPIATPGWTCGAWSWIPGYLGPPLTI